jgi:hypothetical protein
MTVWPRALFLVVSGLLFVAACASDPGDPNDPDNPDSPAFGCRDDGVFCNGIERIVDGKCAKVPAAPCDDGVDCTVDTCNEAEKTCTHTPMGACAMCMKADCTPDCRGKRCGSDGCGGSCGACRPGEGCTAVGACTTPTGLGTCQKPRPLAVKLGSSNVQVIKGDTTNSVHQIVPTCNSTSTAVEDVYVFTITEPTGIEATTRDYDTVLSIRKEDPSTPKSECLDDSKAATVVCSDDSAPPGDYGSRVATLLEPGTYYLIVDGFDDTNFGPYTLRVKFIAGCVPNCDGQFCGGSDGCGGGCGSCGAGMQCGQDLRCRPFPCKPDCKNPDGSTRLCGDDGCLGSCGACAAGTLCVPKTGRCAAFPSCNHEKPTCSPACAAGSFCGSDCACHDAKDALPDLVLNTQRLQDEILFDTMNVDANSCSVLEQCVGGLGKRRLLRFSVEAINQGQAPLVMAPPDERPDQFHFSACHGHYHFDGFASYGLIDKSGKEIVKGRKQAYCMEDTRQYAQGPTVSCSKRFTCQDQGIQAGWSDLYGNALDCQWLDITDVPPGDYKIRVTLNPNRAFEEVTLDNNTAIVPVTIPAK